VSESADCHSDRRRVAKESVCVRRRRGERAKQCECKVRRRDNVFVASMAPMEEREGENIIP